MNIYLNMKLEELQPLVVLKNRDDHNDIAEALGIKILEQQLEIIASKLTHMEKTKWSDPRFNHRNYEKLSRLFADKMNQYSDLCSLKHTN